MYCYVRDEEENMAQPQILLTIGQVAHLFQVHIITVRRWWQSGQFPAPIHPGGTRLIRWEWSAIEKLVAAHRAAATQKTKKVQDAHII